jgi:hypothetical protein
VRVRKGGRGGICQLSDAGRCCQLSGRPLLTTTTTATNLSSEMYTALPTASLSHLRDNRSSLGFGASAATKAVGAEGEGVAAGGDEALRRRTHSLRGAWP